MIRWLLVLCSLFLSLESAEVYVDWRTGNDAACSSLQQLQNGSSAVPCKTLNQALGKVNCSPLCENSQPLLDSAVKLSDGEHVLLECVAILGGENVTVAAENTGMATIKCTHFGNTEVYDNIMSCQTSLQMCSLTNPQMLFLKIAVLGE